MMDKIIVMPLKRYAFLSKACGKNKRDTAIISPMFAFTLPTALPIAIAALPSPAAMDDVISSGKVVPMLTTVAPMMNCGTPDISAILLAESTNQSPPLMIRTSPTRNKNTVRQISPVRVIARISTIVPSVVFHK